MTIRLLASDLDGTLFGPDHVPEPRTVAAINAAHEAGLVIAAVTGRSQFRSVERVTSSGAHLDWFIGSNGGHRINVASGELEERLTFDAAELRETIDRIEANLDDIAFSSEHADGFHYSERFIEYFPTSLDGGPRMSEVTNPSDDDIGKVFVAHREIGTMDLVDLVLPHAFDTMNVTTSGIHFIEITPAGADKGSALARLCAQLGIDRSDVVAFGDNYNDLTMLEWAGRGVAMGNAPDDIKAIADDVTLTNAEFGVAAVIEALLD